jgi:hypothetical protein
VKYLKSVIFLILWFSKLGYSEQKYEVISGLGYISFDSEIGDADSFSGYLLQSKFLRYGNPLGTVTPFIGLGLSYMRASDDDTEVGITRSTRVSGAGLGFEAGASYLLDPHFETHFALGYDVGWARSLNTSVSGSIARVSLSSSEDNKVDSMTCKQLIIRGFYLRSPTWKFGGEFTWDFWGDIKIDRSRSEFSGLELKFMSGYTLK